MDDVSNEMPKLGSRVPADTIERLQWMAEERGTTRADLLRQILDHATRNARPPARYDRHEIAATDAEWQAWRDAATEMGKPLDEWIREMLNGVVRRVLR